MTAAKRPEGGSSMGVKLFGASLFLALLGALAGCSGGSPAQSSPSDAHAAYIACMANGGLTTSQDASYDLQLSEHCLDSSGYNPAP